MTALIGATRHVVRLNLWGVLIFTINGYCPVRAGVKTLAIYSRLDIYQVALVLTSNIRPDVGLVKSVKET